MDEFLSGLAENSVVNVGLPDVEDFRDDVVLEKLDVGDDVEHRALVHPVRERYHLSRGVALCSLFALLREHVHYSIRGYCVILVQSQLLLVLTLVNHLQIIRPKLGWLVVVRPHTVDELYRGHVSVLLFILVFKVLKWG